MSAFLKIKRVRSLVPNYFYFTPGDILSVGYRMHGFGFAFTGICLRIRQSRMQKPNTTFLLRNIFSKVSVELYLNFYGLCRLNFKFLDYARKRFSYRSSKLYYLRVRPNNESWVREQC